MSTQSEQLFHRQKHTSPGTQRVPGLVKACCIPLRGFAACRRGGRNSGRHTLRPPCVLPLKADWAAGWESAVVCVINSTIRSMTSEMGMAYPMPSTSRGGELGRIDPDEFPIQIQQRTAAVSGIDGRIGLNIGGRCTVFIGNAAIERADNPGGYRLAIARALPMATTCSPTSSASESPMEMTSICSNVCSDKSVSATFSTAKSSSSSVPHSWAS